MCTLYVRDVRLSLPNSSEHCFMSRKEGRLQIGLIRPWGVSETPSQRLRFRSAVDRERVRQLLAFDAIPKAGLSVLGHVVISRPQQIISMAGPSVHGQKNKVRILIQRETLLLYAPDSGNQFPIA